MTDHSEAQELAESYTPRDHVLSLLKHALIFGTVLSGLAWMHISSLQGGMTPPEPAKTVVASTLR